MSSTGRGYDRHKSDYYITPKNDVRLFLRKSTDIIGWDISNMNILDPCCGGDIKNDATYTSVIKEVYNPKYLCGIDIRPDSKADIIMNYFMCEKQNMSEHDLIISNPPFNYAKEFIEKSLEFVKDGGYVVFLLRLNFYGSIDRKPLFDKNMPKYCFIHHKRISFTKGSTDSIEYAHFVWQKGYKEKYTTTYLI